MLSTIGIPPDAQVYLTAVSHQLKYMVGFLLTVYMIKLERQRHFMLSPGEQYRRHLKEGGYIPC